jgi:hypothetical protein
MSPNPPKRVVSFFAELTTLKPKESWACAADAVENRADPLMETLAVGVIVEMLPTAPNRSRRPDLSRLGIDPADQIADLDAEQREALADALRSGRATRRLAVAA